MFKTETIFDIPITSFLKEEILKYIITGLQEKEKKLFIVTPNPEMLVACQRNPRLKTLLRTADVSLPDGMGVVWASKILHKSVQARVSGVDLMVDLCQECAEQGLTVGFLGGWGNVAERTANCLKKKFPELMIGFVGKEWKVSVPTADTVPVASSSHPMSSAKDLRAPSGLATRSAQSNSSSRVASSKKIMNPPHIDLLFVAFGFPKQEQWIHDNLDKIPVQAAMGVGGAFDYLSGDVRRAPKWIQNSGFEWLFRLIRQPWRARRQLALIEFVYLVLKERFFTKI
jgi:N-acetylglucosaminyldiphosphoundecaprenol N-acetyl-beta-D-mannosaminyltransferase